MNRVLLSAGLSYRVQGIDGEMDERDALKHRASTSPSVPVPTSASNSGTCASASVMTSNVSRTIIPLQIGNFWSRQNCLVQERHGLEGSEGRKRGMIVEFWKQMPGVSSLWSYNASLLRIPLVAGIWMARAVKTDRVRRLRHTFAIRYG